MAALLFSTAIQSWLAAEMLALFIEGTKKCNPEAVFGELCALEVYSDEDI